MHPRTYNPLGWCWSKDMPYTDEKQIPSNMTSSQSVFEFDTNTNANDKEDSDTDMITSMISNLNEQVCFILFGPFVFGLFVMVYQTVIIANWKDTATKCQTKWTM